MKAKQNKDMTVGDLVMAAYELWGAGKAEKMVRLATKARLVLFRDRPHFLFSPAKGRSL